MSLGNVLREEVRSHRIKVTNVYPGATNTEMWPKDERRKLAPRMMSARGVAEAILNIYQMPPDVVVEDIVLRPIGGDIG
jgi:short-subunit dehydrogenase